MSRDIVVYASKEIVWTISAEPIANLETFGRPAHIVSLRQALESGAPSFLRVPIESHCATSADLAHALGCLRLTAAAVRQHGPWAVSENALQSLAATARIGFARHGWATMWRGNQALSTPFVADRGCYRVFDRSEVRPSAAEIAEALGRPIVFPDLLPFFAQKRKEVSVHMGEDVLGGRHRGDGDLFEHLWSPLANLGSLLNPFMHHCRSIRDLTDILYEDAGADCIKELRIHSHGNSHVIRMGTTDIIDQHEADDRRAAGEAGTQPSFGPGGMTIPDSDLARLIDALRKTMCKPSKIIFDACEAAAGTLLQDLSRNLGPDITVNGFMGTGNPLWDGDTNFRNGARV